MALVVLSITWDVYKDYTIRDVHVKMQPSVIEYMMRQLRTSKVMQLLHINSDPEGSEDMSVVIKSILQNECSMVVVDKDNVIKGAALCYCMTKQWKSWTAMKLLNTAGSMEELLNITIKALEEHNLRNPDERLEDCLHIFYIKVDEDLREDPCFMKRFYGAMSELGRHMKLPYVSLLAFTNLERDLLAVTDFQESTRIIYSMYIHNRRRPFDKLRDMDEMYAALYVKKLEPLTHYDDIVLRHPQLMIKDPKSKPGRRSAPNVVKPQQQETEPAQDQEED